MILKGKTMFMNQKLMVRYINGKNIRLVNRRGIDKLKQYPELKDLPKYINAKSAVLDGELAIYNEKGLPDFNLLQKREHITSKFAIDLRSKEYPATYIVFDILEKDGKKLIRFPLKKRRKILEETIKENEIIQLMFQTKNGEELFKKIRELNAEGVMAKDEKSKYFPGERSRFWLKIKNLKTIDCIIVGYSHEKRKISALCLGLYKGKKLIYIGRVGTGFTEKFIEELYKKLEALKIKKIPVINPPPDWKKHNIVWIKPDVVCEVKFLELTKGLELRAPSFQKIRIDKPPSECNFEQVKEK